jgi:uncharacterized membrane protein
MTEGAMSSLAGRPRMAAWTGLLFLLPFWIMNAIVALRIEPVFSWVRPGPHTSPQEYVLLAVVLLLLPVGAVWALIPSLKRSADGKRKFHAANAAVAMLLILFFVSVAGALGAEIYACEVMQIPNCD